MADMAGRAVLTGPMKSDTARRMRRTAATLDDSHPEMVTSGHVRDAAKVLEHGSTEGAKRHLDAAMETLTPRNLIRHGVTDDEGHAHAKVMMHQINRHRLAVMDIEDANGKNEQLAQAKQQAHLASQQAVDARQAQRAAQKANQSPGGQDAALFSNVELGMPWQHEARDPGGQWMKIGSPGAQQLHGRMVTGLAARGRQVTGIYDGRHGTVIARHSGGVPVTHVAPTASPGPGSLDSKISDRLSKISFGASRPGIELAFNAAETRDQFGRWMRVAGHIREAQAASSRGDETAARASLRKAEDAATGPMAAVLRSARQARETGDTYTSGRRVRQAMSMMGGAPPQRLSFSGVDLSARTAMLERTPAPRGRPGGPGLYDVSGLGHSAYFQQVVKALIEKRGMTPGKAYPIAYAALRKWRRGGGHVHPEVQAAAGGALASEAAKGATARAMHGHSNGSGGIELAAWTNELRSTHGQWIRGIGSPQALAYDGPPGGFGHIRAIEAMGQKYAPKGETRNNVSAGAGSEVLRTSLRSAARFLASRQLDHAARALTMAEWAARHTGPQAQLDVRAVKASLAGVPKGVGPMHYPPGPHPSSNPLQVMGYSTWQEIGDAVELAATAGGAGGSGGRQGKQQQQKQQSGNARSQNAQNEARVPKGQFGGGRFGSGGGQAQQGKSKNKHPHNAAARAARKAQLEKKAASLRAQIHALVIAYRAATAHHKASSAKAAKTAKQTPAQAAAAAKKATAAKTAASTPAKKGAAKAKALSPAGMHSKIIALRAVLASVLAQIHSLANEYHEAIDLAAWEHELRDSHGRFSKGGGGSGSSLPSPPRTPMLNPMTATMTPPSAARWQNRISGMQAQHEMQTARTVVADAEQRMKTEENHRHKTKLAVHAGLIAAGGVLALILAHFFGSTEAVGAIGAGTPLLVQEIVDWAKKL